jgi:hypothetical protein
LAPNATNDKIALLRRWCARFADHRARDPARPKVVLWLPKQVIPESVGCFKSPAGTGYICPE